MLSIDAQFNEALAALDKVGKRSKFEEKRKPKMSVEAQLNLAEEVLKESRIIRKHNGTADNRGELFIESDGGSYVSADSRESEVASYMLLGLTDSEARRVIGLPDKVEGLTESQAREYQFAKLIGISESDALTLAKKI